VAKEDKEPGLVQNRTRKPTSNRSESVCPPFLTGDQWRWGPHLKHLETSKNRTVGRCVCVGSFGNQEVAVRGWNHGGLGCKGRGFQGRKPGACSGGGVFGRPRKSGGAVYEVHLGGRQAVGPDK